LYESLPMIAAISPKCFSASGAADRLGIMAALPPPSPTSPPSPDAPGRRTEAAPADWSSVSRSAGFLALIAAKRRFVIPASIFFILYYFALPVMVGYFPALMERRVIGAINLAYLFALSQFFMAWAIMWLYIRAARRWDAMEHEIIAKVHRGNHEARGESLEA
jgi:uncharacterized membrane protein (DUF485 family)